MDEWDRNKEGYADSTAGIAIWRVSKEERKIAMAKKRSCRRTISENIIHEKAVKMRRMTDEKLVFYVQEQIDRARNDGFNLGKKQITKSKPVSIEEIIKEIEKVRGIGVTKLADIQEILAKHLGDF